MSIAYIHKCHINSIGCGRGHWMSLSFWAIHSCQYKGMVYCSELQFLFREEIFKIRTGFPHHVPLFLSCWFPFASLRQFSLHCNSQTSVLWHCKWRKDTDYRAVEELCTPQSTPIAALLSTSLYIGNVNSSSYLGLQQPDACSFFLTWEQNESLSSYCISIPKTISLLLNITDIPTSEFHKLLTFLM